MENRPHNEEFREKWFRMPVTEQMADIGKEVAEAIRWKEKGDHQKTRSFCNNAIELLILTEEDPKHGRCAVEEFNSAVEELRDYFLGDNIYGTTDEMLMHYYGTFMSRRNKHYLTRNGVGECAIINMKELDELDKMVALRGLMKDLDRAKARADREGWIDADEAERILQ